MTEAVHGDSSVVFSTGVVLVIKITIAKIYYIMN